MEKSHPSETVLNGLATDIKKHSDELGGKIAVAWDVLNDKISSCDFPSRLLFIIIQEMYALRFAMLSWSRALYVRQSDSDKQDTATLLLNQLDSLTTEVPQKINKALGSS